MNKKILISPTDTIINTNDIGSILSRLQNQSNPSDVIKKIMIELTAGRAALQSGTKPDQLSISTETEAVTQISKQIQATIVASSVVQGGETDLIRDDVLAIIDHTLHSLAAVQLQLRIDPSQLSNLDLIAERYNVRHAANENLTDWTKTLLNLDVERWDQRGQATVERWIPLETMKSKSVSELIRYIIRAVPISDQIDENFTSILFELTKGTLPELNIDLNQARQTQEAALERLARAQDVRDRIGATFASYLAKLLVQHVQTYESEFQAAYESALQEVQRQYQADPSIIPTMNPEVEKSPANQTPLIMPTKEIAEQIPIPTSTTTSSSPPPTVDFRHVPAASNDQATPPNSTPPPTPAPSIIKPIDIQ